MTQAITITISDRLYEQLQRTAELSQRPIDVIIEQSLGHSISPLIEEIPPHYQADVYPLLGMSEEELYEETRRVFSPERWAEYETLLSAKEERRLSSKENERLDALRRAADVLMLRKAYAAVLLKRRGFNPPAINELPPVT